MGNFLRAMMSSLVISDVVTGIFFLLISMNKT